MSLGVLGRQAVGTSKDDKVCELDTLGGGVWEPAQNQHCPATWSKSSATQNTSNSGSTDLNSGVTTSFRKQRQENGFVHTQKQSSWILALDGPCALQFCTLCHAHVLQGSEGYPLSLQ